MNDLAFLESLSTPALLLAALAALGRFLKRTPHVQDWMIPYLLCAVGSVAYNAVGEPGLRSTLTGFLVGLIAVGGHQLLRQATEGRREDTQFLLKKDHEK